MLNSCSGLSSPSKPVSHILSSSSTEIGCAWEHSLTTPIFDNSLFCCPAYFSLIQKLDARAIWDFFHSYTWSIAMTELFHTRSLWGILHSFASWFLWETYTAHDKVCPCPCSSKFLQLVHLSFDLVSLWNCECNAIEQKFYLPSRPSSWLIQQTWNIIHFHEPPLMNPMMWRNE